MCNIWIDDQSAGYEYLVNPLIRKHPLFNYRKSLWISPGDMECFEDLEPDSTSGSVSCMSPEDSHDLLRELLTPGTKDGYVYEHEWEMGDYAIWDNRQVIHSTAGYDYDSVQRHLHHGQLK